VDEVEVIGDGVAEIYVTVDGGTPEIAGQWAWLLPAVFSVRSLSSEANGLPTVVQLISDGAPTYHVLRSR
jgi:hypothetical protein